MQFRDAGLVITSDYLDSGRPSQFISPFLIFGIAFSVLIHFALLYIANLGFPFISKDTKDSLATQVITLKIEIFPATASPQKGIKEEANTPISNPSENNSLKTIDQQDTDTAQSPEQESIINVAELLDSISSLDLDSSKEAISDGRIFDQGFQQKLDESRSRNRPPPTPESYSYKDNFANETVVDGDTCYKVTVSEGNPYARNWSLPYLCPWVKSESRQMADRITEALKR